MTRTKTLIAAAVGGLAALLLVGSAWRTRRGLVGKVDVLAQALGISAEEVEQAKEDGTLKDPSRCEPRRPRRRLVDARDAAIDAAVEAGDITAEQAELLRDTAKGSADAWAEATTVAGTRAATSRRLVGRQERQHLRRRPGVVPPNVGRTGQAKGRREAPLPCADAS